MKKELIIVIVLGTVIPLSWFKDGLLIAGGDMGWLLDPGNFIDYFKYAWNIKFYNGGFINFSNNTLIPIVLFWAFFKYIGLSLLTIEKIWFVFLFLFPGLSMYYLMSEIYNKPLAKLISALLYMLNLYIIVTSPFQLNIKPILIALPLIMAFWIKGLNNKNNNLNYSVLIGFSSLIYAQSNGNPPQVAVIPIILIFYSIFYIITNKSVLIVRSASGGRSLLIQII